MIEALVKLIYIDHSGSDIVRCECKLNVVQLHSISNTEVFSNPKLWRVLFSMVNVQVVLEQYETISVFSSS